MVLHDGKMRGKTFKIKDVPTRKAFTTNFHKTHSSIVHHHCNLYPAIKFIIIISRFITEELTGRHIKTG